MSLLALIKEGGDTQFCRRLIIFVLFLSAWLPLFCLFFSIIAFFFLSFDNLCMWGRIILKWLYEKIWHETARLRIWSHVLILFVTCFIDTQQWRSNLRDAGVTISKFLRPLNCELVNSTSPNQCSSWDVTEENISALLSAQTHNCTVTSDDCGGQNISKHTAEDYACKQFLAYACGLSWNSDLF